MGEPIKLPDGRIAYGQAQAAKMLTGFVGPQEDRIEAIDPEPLPSMPTDWTRVKGVSGEISAALHYMNLNTPADVLNYATMSGGDLTAIPGIGKARAAAIVAWAEGQL